MIYLEIVVSECYKYLLFLCHHYTILSATLQEGLEICGRKRGEAEEFGIRNSELWGAGLQWRPLPQAKAPTESADEIRRLRRCVKGVNAR